MENAPAPTETANPLPKGCLPGLHPQRQRFDFDEISIDTLFDSANLANATKYKNFHYNLTIAPDGYLTSAQTTNKTWFYFRITNIQKRGKYTFTITNMNRQNKLYESGLLPVYRAIPSSPEWRTVAQQTILMRSVDKDLEVTFNHELSPQDQEVYLAFTFPWSYTDDQEMINQYELQLKDDQEIYFHRELLTQSRENRKIELITISSYLNKTEEREQLLPSLFPSNNEIPRPFKFENKKYVFISARVHPGETPASYTFRGLIRFLLDKNDPRSKAFRDNFVIFLIPMLNPDGVSRGHYRMDTYGLNLNRFYIKPETEKHPSIYAVKQVVLDLHNQGKLFLYCDLHAHANVKGIFTYGNNMNFREQVEGRLFPKLMSLNSQYFEYSRCDFSETNTGLEKAEGQGKDRDGAGRVALYKDTNNPKCYTLECNYASGKIRNVIQSVPQNERRLDADTGSNVNINPADIKDETVECFDPYTYQNFEEVGEAIGPSLLDMIGQNPLSRITAGAYKNVTNVKLNIALTLMKDLKFRFDPFLRKVNADVQSNLEVLQKYIEEGIQLEPASKPKKEPISKLKKKPTTVKKPKDAQKDTVIDEAEKIDSLNELAPKTEIQNDANANATVTVNVNSEANEA